MKTIDDSAWDILNAAEEADANNMYMKQNVQMLALACISQYHILIQSYLQLRDLQLHPYTRAYLLSIYNKQHLIPMTRAVRWLFAGCIPHV